MWLLAESAVLKGLSKRAIFLVGVPFDSGAFPRAWAGWASSKGVTWLGPRHTNMPDGSICAFVPDSGIWKPGDPLIELLDYYTEWAARHLYLEVFGKWPGPQDAPHAYYRRVEFKDNELCSCHSGKAYGECCKAEDELTPLEELKVDFRRRLGTDLVRNPPRQVIRFFEGRRRSPPTLAEMKIVP